MKGHDAIFCEGVCDAWLHRHCAGLSQLAFAELQNSKDSFLCHHCQLKLYKLEISNLRQLVDSLKDSVIRLEDKLGTSQPVVVSPLEPVPSFEPVVNTPVPSNSTM